MPETREQPPVRPMFIGGRWVRAEDGEAIPVVSPVDGKVFDAISQQRGQLQQAIQNNDTVFTTTARRDQDLKALFSENFAPRRVLKKEVTVRWTG